MDKDLLRLVIIATGATIILGMICWSLFSNKRKKRKIDFYDKGDPLNNIDESLILDTDHDDFDVVPLGSALDDDLSIDPEIMEIDEVPDQTQQQEVSGSVPDIIQFSVVAKNADSFNGTKLVEVFQLVGLEYGSMKVFERIDDQRRVDFAVASMVEPGTFPETDLQDFNTPGIVFFLQPKVLDKPLPVFDDFVQIIQILATGLNGDVLDHNRQPLSDATIEQFRLDLS